MYGCSFSLALGSLCLFADSSSHLRNSSLYPFLSIILHPLVSVFTSDIHYLCLLTLSSGPGNPGTNRDLLESRPCVKYAGPLPGQVQWDVRLLRVSVFLTLGSTPWCQTVRADGHLGKTQALNAKPLSLRPRPTPTTLEQGIQASLSQGQGRIARAFLLGVASTGLCTQPSSSKK